MVGFGSSLRKGRRPGWEGGYLDYETLKLLLSQIESFYDDQQEELLDDRVNAFVRGGGTSARNRERSSSPAVGGGARVGVEGRRRGGGASRHHHQGPSPTGSSSRHRKRDYREDLFLESDSDVAYCSVVEVDVENENEGHYLDDLPDEISTKPFTLSYSHEAPSSDDEADDDSREDAGCGTHIMTETLSSWRRWDSSNNNNNNNNYNTLASGAKKKKASSSGDGGELNVPSAKKKHHYPSSGGEDFGTSAISTAAHHQYDSFFLSESAAPKSPQPAYLTTGANYHDPSFFNRPTYPATEISSLLQPGSGASLTPPHKPSYPRHHSKKAVGAPSVASSTTSPLSRAMKNKDPANNAMVTSSLQQYQQERQHQRLLRRVRRRKRQTRRHARKRARKVPLYLRVAHQKSRDVTERFLGLLRAETEKILLFAQSRLGELADTAGSLRFTINDDIMNRNHNIRGSRSYEYPLSDAGLHPSSSSSDEDGGGGHPFPWSDSSDEAASRDQPTTYSAVSGANDAARSTSSQHNLRGINAKESSAARRQIAHYTEIRKNRNVFQRNDHILGEDLLFLSAIEEADGFTAVGVELLHILRFICVNLIAVRKICRKHDRLLMNRMLGGYYHRMRSSQKNNGSNSHLGDANTLGGLLAQSSGDVYEAHPARIGYKLCGVYDKKIAKLANSRTVQVISSCLALALSEYEVARSRAHLIANLNSSAAPKQKDSENLCADDNSLLEGPPSTASNMSLTRLRFTVTSIFAFREASRNKLNHFQSYLSRNNLSFTGQPIRGDGLDGCSRETLDFLVSYNPDSALLLDSSQLFEGLAEGKWTLRPMSEVMVATLAVGTIPENLSPDAAVSSLLLHKEKIVSNAVSVYPESRAVILKRLLPGYTPKQVPLPRSFAVLGLPEVLLRLNRISSFLYMMNYFVAHATTELFVRGAGASPGHLAMIIGAPNLSAIFAAIFQCWILSNLANLLPGRRVRILRRLFILSSLFGVIGGAVHGAAVITDSVHLAILGRFLFGFSFPEIICRQVVGLCLPSHIVGESARLMEFRVAGMILGLLFGSFAEAVPIAINNVSIRVVQLTSWVMTTLWFIHAVRICCQLNTNEGTLRNNAKQEKEEKKEYDSDSSKSDIGTTSSDHVGSSSSLMGDNPLTASFAKARDGLEALALPIDGDFVARSSSPSPLGQKTKRPGMCRHINTYGSRLRKLLSYNVCIPITFLILLLSSFATEVFFTATPIIGSRYFGWSGAHSGTFLGFLAAFILPINFVCERIARKYEERTVLKRSLRLIVVGLFVMVNWESLFTLASHAEEPVSNTGSPSTRYDWKLGIFQYTFGLAVTFVGLTALDGSNLSLLSKMSPQRLRGLFLNIGTITTFLSLFARLSADAVVMVDLSHKLMNTDIVNVLVIPLFLVCFVPIYLVKKHYFFLL